MYLGFYTETVDWQKIAWVGTLLTDTVLAWYLHHYRDLNDQDTRSTTRRRSGPNIETSEKPLTPNPTLGN